MLNAVSPFHALETHRNAVLMPKRPARNPMLFNLSSIPMHPVFIIRNTYPMTKSSMISF